MNIRPSDLARASISVLPRVEDSIQQHHISPNGANPSPSYAEIIKKKPTDSSGSYDEDSIEKFSKKVERKSQKEAREEEVERLKM